MRVTKRLGLTCHDSVFRLLVIQVLDTVSPIRSPVDRELMLAGARYAEFWQMIHLFRWHVECIAEHDLSVMRRVTHIVDQASLFDHRFELLSLL